MAGLTAQDCTRLVRKRWWWAPPGIAVLVALVTMLPVGGSVPLNHGEMTGTDTVVAVAMAATWHADAR